MEVSTSRFRAGPAMAVRRSFQGGVPWDVDEVVALTEVLADLLRAADGGADVTVAVPSEELASGLRRLLPVLPVLGAGMLPGRIEVSRRLALEAPAARVLVDTRRTDGGLTVEAALVPDGCPDLRPDAELLRQLLGSPAGAVTVTEDVVTSPAEPERELPHVRALDMPAWWLREEKGLLALRATRCDRCGAVEFPAPVTEGHPCGGAWVAEELRPAGTVVASTVDRLYDEGGPVGMAVAELDGGGRFYGQVAAGWGTAAPLPIGSPIRLVPRGLSRHADGWVYFWKLLPEEALR